MNGLRWLAGTAGVIYVISGVGYGWFTFSMLETACTALTSSVEAYEWDVMNMLWVFVSERHCPDIFQSVCHGEVSAARAQLLAAEWSEADADALLDHPHLKSLMALLAEIHAQLQSARDFHAELLDNKYEHIAQACLPFSEDPIQEDIQQFRAHDTAIFKRLKVASTSTCGGRYGASNVNWGRLAVLVPGT